MRAPAAKQGWLFLSRHPFCLRVPMSECLVFIFSSTVVFLLQQKMATNVSAAAVASAVTSSASSAANGAAAASGAGTIVSFLVRLSPPIGYFTIRLIFDFGQWMGFALLFIAFLMCSYFTYNESYGRRMPHYVSLLICGLASLAYLSMATGNGSMVRADGRVFYWARYIDWLVTTPLLLYEPSHPVSVHAPLGLRPFVRLFFCSFAACSCFAASSTNNWTASTSPWSLGSTMVKSSVWSASTFL